MERTSAARRMAKVSGDGTRERGREEEGERWTLVGGGFCHASDSAKLGAADFDANINSR